jgi:hypothetical protein
VIRVFRRSVLSTLIMLSLTSPAWGVVIVTESGMRIGGYPVKDDGTTVTVRRKRADGSETEDKFERAKVTVIQSVKAERLEELRPETPRAYRDYAEELAAKKDDPEARDVSIRLFLIAASLDPDGLGRSCLLAAAPLARDVQEERRFKALAYLLDPKHDKDSLKEPPRVAPADSLKSPEWKKFVAALQAYRKGNFEEAVKRANEPGVSLCFSDLPGFVTHKDFLAKCSGPQNPKGPPDAGSDLIRQIVRIELQYEEATQPLTTDPKAGNAGGPWQAATAPGGRVGPPPLVLEALTEFDPRECVFRAGKWQRPEAGKKP